MKAISSKNLFFESVNFLGKYHRKLSLDYGIYSHIRQFRLKVSFKREKKQKQHACTVFYFITSNTKKKGRTPILGLIFLISA